ncbi:MAG: hypothetical protein F4164_01555 [Gemmatimonadales bacterium]|nr:hypothetical protein [Gemmatimonadales bacterium]MYG48061.1 hypothetical protein [Gemmatimonadales bacterium]MYK01815.1 hypothetical protein [Candidatus Palauibacter ramosifaciens]
MLRLCRGLPGFVSGLAIAACGGGTTDPPPPPPPLATGCGGAATPSVSVTLDLTPGQHVTLDNAADIRAFRLAGSDASRDYQVIVQSASQAPGQSVDGCMRVRAERASGNATPPRPPRLTSGGGELSRNLRRRASWFARERVLRERDLRELAAVGAQPVRSRTPGLDPLNLADARQPPDLGDTLSFRVGVGAGLIVNCRNPTTVLGEVRYAGEHFTIVEDLQFHDQPDSDRFSAAEFEAIGRELDEVVYPVDVAYFGGPADIDNNGTVFALFTAEVNKLTPAGEESVVAGFFLARDLTSRSSCEASNEGEIFYLVGLDPDEDFGAEIDREFGNALARSTVAHEFAHLLNTQQRVTLGSGNIFGDREVAWLDEGMAHLAEEVAGLRAAGFGTRSNLDLDMITTGEEQLAAYNHFHIVNQIRLGRFLRGGCPPDPDGPGAAPALGDAVGEDPGGVESLAFRGFAYGFVRWLGDQFGASGSGGALPGSREEELFRYLTSGGPAHFKGVTNVERTLQTVAGVEMEWEELLSLYLTSLVADDRVPAEADPRTQWTTWNLPALYRQLSESNLGDRCPFTRDFPLTPSRVNVHVSTNSSTEFTVNSSTGRYFSLVSSGATPGLVVEVMDPAGADLPDRAQAQVTVLRTR